MKKVNYLHINLPKYCQFLNRYFLIYDTKLLDGNKENKKTHFAVFFLLFLKENNVL